jgi:hypothetical protein
MPPVPAPVVALVAEGVPVEVDAPVADVVPTAPLPPAPPVPAESAAHATEDEARSASCANDERRRSKTITSSF